MSNKSGVLLHTPLFAAEFLNMLHDAEDKAFAFIVKVVEIKLKIEIKMNLGGKIEKDVKSEDDEAEDEGENGNGHGPFGQARPLFSPPSCCGEDAEKGEENAEKGRKSAENGDDGHNTCGQGSEG